MSPHFLLPLAGAAVSAATQTLRAVGEQFGDSASFLLGGGDESGEPSSSGPESTGHAEVEGPKLRGPLSQLLGASGAGVSDQAGLFRQIEVLQQHIQQASQELHNALAKQLTAAGVSLPVELEGDGFGRVQVVGAHAQRSEIEEFFASRPQLTAAFNNLTTNISLLQNLSEQGSTLVRSENVRLRVDQHAVATQR